MLCREDHARLVAVAEAPLISANIGLLRGFEVAPRERNELVADRIDLPHFLRREIAHNGAAVRNTPDDSLLLQFEQSEAHIAAMGVEALAEILLDQVLARMAPAEDDVLFQAPRDDAGDRLLADRDRRPLTRCARCPGAKLTGHRFSFGRPKGHGSALSRRLVYNIKNYIVNNLGRP